MGRIKTNKEYSIKLIHPEFGEYYLNYIRDNNQYCYGYAKNKIGYSYIFTKNLNKVTTWKNAKTIESTINLIKDSLCNGTCEILLSLGKEVKEEIIDKLICSRKKYYFRILFATSQPLIDEAKKNINSLNISLLRDSELIMEAIKNGGHIEKDFSKQIKKLDSQVSKYRTDYLFLEEAEKSGVLLDIVDASYGFRFLKLKNLKNLNNESEELEELED